jgi:hypothetical protein
MPPEADRLADQPSPLYQLPVLATLPSTRISAGVAVAAARELFAAGYRAPAAMAPAPMTGASWPDRVHALGRVSFPHSSSPDKGHPSMQ